MKTNIYTLGPLAFVLGLVTICILLVNLTARPAIVVGQEGKEEPAEQQTEEAPEEAVEEAPATEEAAGPMFRFVAKECDAMTFMARKSLILFDEANEDISLSEEAIVFAETNIIQESGPRLLEIGETVTIDSTLVEKFARESENLSDAQIAAWSVYTGNVDFELAEVEPVNDVAQAVTPEADREAEAQEQAAAAAESSGGDDLSDADTVSESITSPIWWVAGGGAVAGLWYLLYRRNETEE